MARPSDVIPVKYSEDLAQYADLRPVRRQPMTLEELVGLVLATTGKDRERVRTILERGTCCYNIYRYWWEGFAVENAALETLLARFPDPDPARRFDPRLCLWAQFADAHEPRPHTVLLERGEAEHRRWFRRQSFWDFLMELAGAQQPDYQDYSYYHRADLYRAPLTPAERALLDHQGRRLAPRGLARQLARGSDWVLLELACRR